MEVKALFFSRLRDVVGENEVAMDLHEKATVADLMEALYARTPELRSWDQNILVGIGVEFVARSHSLKHGDEVAIMPPLQGG